MRTVARGRRQTQPSETERSPSLIVGTLGVRGDRDVVNQWTQRQASRLVAACYDRGRLTHAEASRARARLDRGDATGALELLRASGAI